VNHVRPISTKIARDKGAHDVIILSNFGFNIFRRFISIGGQNLHLPIDFARHRYSSAAATAHPVTKVTSSFVHNLIISSIVIAVIKRRLVRISGIQQSY